MNGNQQGTGAREALLAAARAELVEHGHAAVSLRAVARRAGLSRAAPTYFFGDRAGMLTAVAAEGFAALAGQLRAVRAGEPVDLVSALGRAYIDFGLDHRALFDLMFRPSELNPDDPQLQQEQRAAIGELSRALTGAPVQPEAEQPAPSLSLVSWALVHGLVVLTRDGALERAADVQTAESAADLARSLTDLYVARMGFAGDDGSQAQE